MFNHNNAGYGLTICRNDNRKGVCFRLPLHGYYRRVAKVFVLLVVLAVLINAPHVWALDSPNDLENGVMPATLDNGLRVVIVRNPLSPAVTAVVNYLVGSDESPAGFPGMAHAQEHMMFRGSPGLSADQLSNITASMGGMFNADTQQSVTQYFFTVPAEDLETALHIEALRMHGVLDSEELWRQERGAIEQEVAQDLSVPEYIFFSRLLEGMFKGTPYEHDALGTRSSFEETTGAMLKKFHDAWYVPNNAILVIVGNVQPQEVLAQVKRLFGDIPEKKLPAHSEIRPGPVMPETINLYTDRPYGMAVLAFRMPGCDSPDYAAALVLADVLDSRRGSLYALVPEGKALDIDFQIEVFPKAGLGYVIATFPQGSDARPLIDDLHKVLSSVKSSGVPPDMVEAAKRHKVSDAEMEKNSVSGLAFAWSKALAVEGRRSPDEDVDAVRKVSVEDVNRLARTCLDTDHSITAILTPTPSGKPAASKGFGGSESFTPEKITPVRLPEWASESLKRLSIPSSTLNPVVSVLPNGIKLIVQSESVSDTICVYGHVRNNPDLEVPSGKEGVNDVLEDLFSFGTQSLDRVTFLKALDDIGADESAGTDFTLKVLSDQFDRGLELLADNELHPALPEKAFETIRSQEAATVAGRMNSPGYLAERAILKALYPSNDPTLRQSTPPTVSSLSITDVREYYRKVFRPDMTTIVVIGKIEPSQAKAVIEKYFGDWKAPEELKPDTLLPPVPANVSSITVVPNSSRVQDKVTLAETLGLNRSNPDYYALQLGNHILGGAFYATRLYRDMREKAGLVYNVSSSLDIERTRALYMVEYACDPPNAGKARAIVERNLTDMRTTLVSPEELQQAKALLLRGIPLSESDVDGIAEGFLRRTEMDLPLDEPVLAARHYVKLTAGEVKEAFLRWLRPDDLIQVTEGPYLRGGLQ
jgi:zinc protease